MYFLYLYTFSFGLVLFVYLPFVTMYCICNWRLFVMVYLEIKWIDSQKFYFMIILI